MERFVIKVPHLYNVTYILIINVVSVLFMKEVCNAETYGLKKVMDMKSHSQIFNTTITIFYSNYTSVAITDFRYALYNLSNYFPKYQHRHLIRMTVVTANG